MTWGIVKGSGGGMNEPIVSWGWLADHDGMKTRLNIPYNSMFYRMWKRERERATIMLFFSFTTSDPLPLSDLVLTSQCPQATRTTWGQVDWCYRVKGQNKRVSKLLTIWQAPINNHTISTIVSTIYYWVINNLIINSLYS
jgi:hypothetical protein